MASFRGKLSLESENKMIEKYLTGSSYKEIQAEFEISPNTISEIIKREKTEIGKFIIELLDNCKKNMKGKNKTNNKSLMSDLAKYLIIREFLPARK